MNAHLWEPGGVYDPVLSYVYENVRLSVPTDVYVPLPLCGDEIIRLTGDGVVPSAF